MDWGCRSETCKLANEGLKAPSGLPGLHLLARPRMDAKNAIQTAQQCICDQCLAVKPDGFRRKQMCIWKILISSFKTISNVCPQRAALQFMKMNFVGKKILVMFSRL